MIGLLAALAVVLGGCDWPMVGFDPGHSGASPDTGISKQAVAGSMVLDWTASFTSLDTGASPAVVNGVVYEPVEQQNGSTFSFALEAFDANGTTNCGGSVTTCSPLWTAPTTGVTAGSPAVANGVVYVGGDDFKLYAFDATGHTNCAGTPKVCSPLWTATLGSEIRSSVTVAGGVVYVGDLGPDHSLYAFDAGGTTNCGGTPKTCSPLWTAATGGSYRDMLGTAAVANGTVYVGSSDGTLYAFDAAGKSNCTGAPKTCTPLWTAQGGNASTVPVVVNGVVYAGSTSLYAFDAVGDTNCGGTPKTCNPLWTAPGAASSPAVAGGVVYVDGARGFSAFDAAGKANCTGTPKTCTPLWTATTGGVVNAPAVANGIVYAGSFDGDLYAFDAGGTVNCGGTPKTCSPLWKTLTGASYVDAPVIANFGHVYVSGGINGRLYAYGVEHVPPRTTMLLPHAGDTLAGTATLDASAVDNVGVSTVEFHLTGGAFRDATIATAASTPFGWAAHWNTASVPNGVYTLHSVATDPADNRAQSPDVAVTVQN